VESQAIWIYYCTPDYLTYLFSIIKGNSHVIFNPPVVGAAHQVFDESREQVVRGYVDALFKVWCYSCTVA
jgi:hypothetical protein